MRKALLFDLDGTMIDTEALHLQAFQELFGREGVDLDRHTYERRIMGAPNQQIAAEFLPHLPAADAAAIMARKEVRYRELISDPAVALAPTAGLFLFLEMAKALGFACGVVTNAPRANADILLQSSGLAPSFDTVVSADELARGKPDPLPYLTGLDRLSATAATSLAFEDSRSGVRSAVAAGLRTIGITSTLSAQDLKDLGASLTVADFTNRDLLMMLDDLAG